ncbi:DUF2924 domain-containing protein [Aestuariibius insulae]|uniref:DUF2924 domain-containing protein n=1 Tax=Aestuariibius insulae TaxID=2058287 RepID=UPI00345E54F4
MSRHDTDRPAADLQALAEASRADCLARWRAAFGRPPPKHLSLPLLRKLLIWQRQTEALGELFARTERELDRLASGSRVRPVTPGSRLVREWNGRTYRVEVTEDGYLMDGRSWRSLSAIARHITGAHWSGPRFFGLA